MRWRLRSSLLLPLSFGRVSAGIAPSGRLVTGMSAGESYIWSVAIAAIVQHVEYRSRLDELMTSNRGRAGKHGIVGK